MFETRPRYEPLETKSRPIFQLKIAVFSKSNYWNYAVFQWSDARLTSTEVLTAGLWLYLPVETPLP